MVEFADNNNISFATTMLPFYLNKDFHSRMSFSLHSIFYESTRERLQVTTAEDISKRMKELLEFGRDKLIQAQRAIKDQADKHRSNITFDIGDKIYISLKDIKTTRLSKTLENKWLRPYSIIGKVETSYRL